MKLNPTLLLISVSLVLSLCAASATEHPNIVLLMGDDHGWDETGYNGHPYLKPSFSSWLTANLR